MPYTNNVPQANQTIASTTTPIRNNFAFIETDAQVEHCFNALPIGQAEGTHIKASMPNTALSPALPMGTTGIYFVSSALAYYYDGTTNWQLSQFQTVLTGTFTPTSTSTFTNMSAVPANVVGFGLIYTGGAVQSFSFSTNGTNCFAYSNTIKFNSFASPGIALEMNNNNAALMLQARLGLSSSAVFTYKIWYRPI